jgi:hypothetical protein
MANPDARHIPQSLADTVSTQQRHARCLSSTLATRHAEDAIDQSIGHGERGDR